MNVFVRCHTCLQAEGERSTLFENMVSTKLTLTAIDKKCVDLGSWQTRIAVTAMQNGLDEL